MKKTFFEAENQLKAEDQNLLDLKELRNNLESYSYEMRNNLQAYGSFEKYLDEPTKKVFLEQINQVVEWIYGEGEVALKSEYEAKMTKFMEIGEPVKQRHFYYSELDVYYAQFEKISKLIQYKLSEIEHLTPAQTEMIIKKHEDAQKFIESVKADKAAK